MNRAEIPVTDLDQDQGSTPSPNGPASDPGPGPDLTPPPKTETPRPAAATAKKVDQVPADQVKAAKGRKGKRGGKRPGAGRPPKPKPQDKPPPPPLDFESQSFEMIWSGLFNLLASTRRPQVRHLWTLGPDETKALAKPSQAVAKHFVQTEDQVKWFAVGTLGLSVFAVLGKKANAERDFWQKAGLSKDSRSPIKIQDRAAASEK